METINDETVSLKDYDYLIKTHPELKHWYEIKRDILQQAIDNLLALAWVE